MITIYLHPKILYCVVNSNRFRDVLRYERDILFIVLVANNQTRLRGQRFL
jgi:hypothetical protein